jgi:mannose-1-phosphate guanylyltransferase/mannose-6-phosphate isomerase
MSRIVPVVLCGGSGTRLWPRSRASKPKPFLPLVGENTLFEATLLRCANPAHFAPPLVVTGTAHLRHVEAQAPDARVIVEPEAKNTAAAIALAAHRLPGDTVMLVCPSDHHIAASDAFTDAALAAAALAKDGWMVAFGIAPQSPETGFGYIKRGEAIDGGYRVERFVEKPDLATAEGFLADGGYSWNGGLFAFRADSFLKELETHRPALAAAVKESVASGHEDGARFHPDADAFSRIESESVDYAVMEETSQAAMVPADMGWSDIGNWPALRDARIADGNGNVIHGPAELVDCHNVMVDSDGPHVSVIGLNDVVIVVDGGEVLVTTAAGAQRVGKLSGAANQ